MIDRFARTQLLLGEGVFIGGELHIDRQQNQRAGVDIGAVGYGGDDNVPDGVYADDD